MRVPLAVRNLLAELENRDTPERFIRATEAIERLFELALKRLDDGTIFVSTGDIPAMWLRDSTWQLRPMLAACDGSGEVEEIIAAVSRRQAEYVLIDPYANAFNDAPNGHGWHKDFKDQNPWVFERKYELDSLAAFIDLAVRLHRVTGYKEHLDDRFWRAATLAVGIIETELDHERKSYRFVRRYAPRRDYLSHRGYGAPHATKVGLSWSGFRPSDDACVLPYLIPANAHASVALLQLSDVAAEFGRADLSAKAAALGTTIGAAVHEHGKVLREVGDVAGEIYAFEVDGQGSQILTEDPNVPSLLSLPYLGWCEPDDQTYLLTRKWIFSALNPRFIQGRFLAGLNSSHTPRRNIWPLALAIQGLTAIDLEESARCLMLIESTDAGTGRVHESVNVDDPAKFTREWFSWADLTYVHLVLKVNGLSAKAD
ncbi:MAG: hypothetical protein RLZ28_696 [Actinomycetota bacterium]|jgi:meiotically up-regulated gene 157 (Mug157) protein